MRSGWKRAGVAAIAVLATAALGGCYGYGMYGNYGNSYRQQIKTTAAKDTLTAFDLKSLATADGVFQYPGLEWGSTPEHVQEVLGTDIGTTTSFQDGGGYGDLNYSLLVGDYTSVGLMPVFSTEGLTMMTIYFEQVYTAEQLDAIYDELVKACSEAFGEPDREDGGEQTQGRVTYNTQTTFWYHSVSDTQMTSLQIGKTDTGTGTSAVVLGVNSYDPNSVEKESSSEESSSRAVATEEADEQAAESASESAEE